VCCKQQKFLQASIALFTKADLNVNSKCSHEFAKEGPFAGGGVPRSDSCGPFAGICLKRGAYLDLHRARIALHKNTPSSSLYGTQMLYTWGVTQAGRSYIDIEINIY
jgi:hypothetical protein